MLFALFRFAGCNLCSEVTVSSNVGDLVHSVYRLPDGKMQAFACCKMISQPAAASESDTRMTSEGFQMRGILHVAMQVSQDLAGAIMSGQVEGVRNQIHAAVRSLSNRTFGEYDNKEVGFLAYASCRYV